MFAVFNNSSSVMPFRKNTNPYEKRESDIEMTQLFLKPANAQLVKYNTENRFIYYPSFSHSKNWTVVKHNQENRLVLYKNQPSQALEKTNSDSDKTPNNYSSIIKIATKVLAIAAAAYLTYKVGSYFYNRWS